ncbi:type II toxin-antitoxin system Phd/YefM family antitoxin [Prosthecomicrobium sp. N25]|uniref:type II toxin-antitoxin system Phd/YefM family antitoxin n=1 Tax=Prosthecomicrobium sp. N25 TaxID=3129254 RepID=UPI00307781E6
MHIVAEGETTVSELVDLMLSGEAVVITRDGRPVAELSAVPFASPADIQEAAPHEQAKARALLDTILASGPRIDIDVVERVRQMRDETFSGSTARI